MADPAASMIPPDILAYAASIRGVIYNLIVNCVWVGVATLLLCALFYFSNSASRRRPLFIFNAISIALGLATGFLSIYLLVSFSIMI